MSSLLPYNAQQVTVEKLQYNKSADLCYCVMSYVHYHDAVSPAFLEKDYTTHEYSTWVESRYITIVTPSSVPGVPATLCHVEPSLWHALCFCRWRFISLRIYLVTYPLQEVWTCIWASSCGWSSCDIVSCCIYHLLFTLLSFTMPPALIRWHSSSVD